MTIASHHSSCPSLFERSVEPTIHSIAAYESPKGFA
jgi:hypothetical protein